MNPLIFLQYMMCKIDLGTRKLYKGGFMQANTCMFIMYPVLMEKEQTLKTLMMQATHSSEALVTTRLLGVMVRKSN